MYSLTCAEVYSNFVGYTLTLNGIKIVLSVGH